jgi:hypothetical protein
MKATFVKSQVSDLPQWAKGLIGVAIVGTLVYVGYKVYKSIGKMQEKEMLKKEDKAVALELDKLVSSGKPPTIPKSELLGMANKLFTAMDGWGTDFFAIYGTLNRLKTYSDLLGLFDAYGIRAIPSGKWNLAPDTKGTLPVCLSSELTALEINQLNNLMKAKKITYLFS